MVRYGEKMILQVRELNKSIKKKKILKKFHLAFKKKKYWDLLVQMDLENQRL